MSSQSVQAVQINTELQGCAKHWVWGFWQEGVYNHQHLLFSLPELSTTLWTFCWTYLSSTFTFPPSRYLALFHSIMQSTILCSKEIIFSFLTRCIFLYSVQAGGYPSLFLPLASCAMSRNYVKMGRPTNQVQFMSRQLQFEINLLFLARSECSQCIDEKIWAIISETQKVQQISLKQYRCVSVDGVALFVRFCHTE